MSNTIDVIGPDRRQHNGDALERAVDVQATQGGHLERLESAAIAIKRSREALKEVALTLRAELGVQRSRRVADQRLQWIVPVTQPVMLCSQIQRSGGTLVARLFDGHRACFAHPYELRWGRPEKGHWPALEKDGTPDALLAQLDEGWPRRFASKGYHKYTDWTHRNDPDAARHYPFVFDEELQYRVFAAVLGAMPGRSQRSCLNAYLTSLFNAWLDYQNLYGTPKQWVTAFFPRSIMEPDGPDRFFADYPDGLLVTLVREPRGWLSSFSRHVATAGTEEAIDLWVESANASRRAQAARPDRVIVLLFEDLVHRTEAVVRLLCERMGLSFSRVLLEPTFNSMPVLSDSSHVLTTGIDREVTERHLATLTSEQVERVARKATPHYEKIRERYRLTTPA